VYDVVDAIAPIIAISLYLPVLLRWLGEKTWLKEEIKPLDNETG